MNDHTPDMQDRPLLQEPRLWQNEQWTAQVIKNDDDDGWAVAMYREGESEPALVGPWTMGRDKKNPKPLDGSAFITLVKTASEFVRRSEQQLHATLHQSVVVNGPGGRVTVLLDIVPDEDSPYATLSAQDDADTLLAQVKVEAGFKLNRQTAQAWVDADFAKSGAARR
ncbi:hypothetical protein [Limnohabitans sp. 2KL-27]|uniref:hypothetical protein n=1 Tax=Limnohabitans sp. 2KL-27 TaxID=1100705 RepID=UPI000A54DA86|nr:hypothetical protein [Limnohabitans sp. 2KL-27]